MSAIATGSNNVGYILARSCVGLVGRVLVDLAAWPLVASGLMVAAQRFSELAAGALLFSRHRVREAGRGALALSRGPRPRSQPNARIASERCACVAGAYVSDFDPTSYVSSFACVHLLYVSSFAVVHLIHEELGAMGWVWLTCGGVVVEKGG